MYAIELWFAVDGGLMPAPDTVEAQVRHHGRAVGVRVEYVRVRHVGSEVCVVVFVTAQTAELAGEAARALATAVAAQVRQLRPSGTHMWAGDQFNGEETQE